VIEILHAMTACFEL